MLAGVLVLNRDPASSPPPLPECNIAATDEKNGFARLLEQTKPAVVIYFHIAHRWARFHAGLQGAPPAVGSIRSWTAITSRTGDPASVARDRLDESLLGMRRLIFPSAHCRDEGLALGFTYPCPVDVIHNHVHPIFHQETRTVDRRGIVFVGSLIARKNAHLVLQALVHLPHVPATIVGAGPQAQDLQSLAHRLGVADRVTFTGELPIERVRDLVIGAEVLCVPSESEGFSNVYLEALACGTPVVGFRPNLQEIRGRLTLDCGIGLLTQDSEELAAAIEQVLQKKWDHALLRRRALQEFHPSRVVDSYVKSLRAAAD